MARVANAFAGYGDWALVALSRCRTTSTLDSVFVCWDDRGIESVCHERRMVFEPDTAFLYSISTTNPAPTLNVVRVLPDTAIYSIAFTEAGDALWSPGELRSILSPPFQLVIRAGARSE